MPVKSRDAYILLTMDCESAKLDVSDRAIGMSSSGPSDYLESERSIRGFAEAAKAFGYPVTLFVHPEVAVAQSSLLLELQDGGACLGLHLHPYKLSDSKYHLDLGAYPAVEQKLILKDAVAIWEEALRQRPQYFRGGYFSANDNTFGILEELGFLGGSLSNPGRVLPSHCSVWKGAEPYPHRAHTGFRLIAGESEMIEIPVSVAFGRPVDRGHAGEQGFEWPYIPHTYDHKAVIVDILDRFEQDSPRFGTIVTDTHNDHDYADPDCPASVNLKRILETIHRTSEKKEMEVRGITIDTLCDLVRNDSVT
jgi:peptidoglycan/xylan/chitin deacetylase (PgdA/CDA1 family)